MESASTEPTKTLTNLQALAVGDFIYANVIIDIKDLANPKSKSTTATAIKNKEALKRICIVLVSGTTSVQVTYIASFKENKTLPDTLAKNAWYPFAPATQEGTFEPLPHGITDGKAGWASLRKMHTITASQVEKLDGQRIRPEWADRIRANILP